MFRSKPLSRTRVAEESEEANQNELDEIKFFSED
jgi:hypothetical protein